jgi:hypothetical protein
MKGQRDDTFHMIVLEIDHINMYWKNVYLYVIKGNVCMYVWYNLLVSISCRSGRTFKGRQSFDFTVEILNEKFTFYGIVHFVQGILYNVFHKHVLVKGSQGISQVANIRITCNYKFYVGRCLKEVQFVGISFEIVKSRVLLVT